MPQSCESGEIAVACHELAAVLDGKRCVVSVGNDLPSSLRFNAKVRKYPPTGQAVRKRARVNTRPQTVNEGEGISGVRGRFPNLWIRHDPHEPAGSQVRQSKWLWTSGKSSQPVRVSIMFRRLCAMRVNENVDVRYQHVVILADATMPSLRPLRLALCQAPTGSVRLAGRAR